jgi:signal transduction histidine kinase
MNIEHNTSIMKFSTDSKPPLRAKRSGMPESSSAFQFQSTRQSVTSSRQKETALEESDDDITERRLAEERVLELSRHLIKAQEKERNRIARELHDDLNQRLALLSLDLEQLGRQLPSSADELRRRTQELRTSVQTISDDIHRIAYHLHPSKLDALGLVAALSGLCKEISTRQPIRVEFIHCHVPESSPKDVALCIFRIVQEALSNVIKHSGAQEAWVEWNDCSLRPTPN